MSGVLKQYFILMVFSFFTNSLFSQVTASDCIDAINVCTDLNFQITPNGVGAVNELTGPNTYSSNQYPHNFSNPSYGSNNLNPWGSSNVGCLRDGERNSTWMIINVASSGTLEMTIGAGNGANAQAGYYDWALWSYDQNSCADISGNSLAPVRCNWNDFP